MGAASAVPEGRSDLDHFTRNLDRRSTLWFRPPEAGVGTSPGETDPGERLALLHGWDTATLLVKNGHFTRAEIATLRSFAAERQFDVAWHPGMRGDEANHYNRLAKPTLYDAAVALLGPGRSAFLADYRFNVWPATDDRPFFFRFFKWSLLPQLGRRETALATKTPFRATNGGGCKVAPWEGQIFMSTEPPPVNTGENR